MSARRASAVLFAGLFAIQLVLAGVVAACPMWDHKTPGHLVPASAMSGAMSAGMQDDMQGMAMIAESNGAETDDAPCDHPVSPEECRTMAPCAVGILVPASAAEPQPALLPGTVVAALVAMPPSVSSPPELPPPRA